MYRHIVATGNIGDLPIAVLAKIWKVIDDEIKAARAEVATKINKVFRGWRTRLNMYQLVIGNAPDVDTLPDAVWDTWNAESVYGLPDSKIRARSERVRRRWFFRLRYNGLVRPLFKR